MRKTVPTGPLTNNRLIRRLIKLVADLDLDKQDFVIFGSGPLLAHGLRPYVRDLDVVVRGDGWRRVFQHGLPATGSINGAPMAAFWGGLIQFSESWISDAWDADDLIDRAEVIQGLPFAQLADVLAYKLALGRAKDLPDVQLLTEHLLQPDDDFLRRSLSEGRPGHQLDDELWPGCLDGHISQRFARPLRTSASG